jgi:Arc/MetJ-type ribon-helix-helix transcriptional regulator
MATLTVRTDERTERALRDLTADGTSQSEVIRRAIYQAWRERQYARMAEESKQLVEDLGEQQEIRAIREDMDAVSAW